MSILVLSEASSVAGITCRRCSALLGSRTLQGGTRRAFVLRLLRVVLLLRCCLTLRVECPLLPLRRPLLAIEPFFHGGDSSRRSGGGLGWKLTPVSAVRFQCRRALQIGTARGVRSAHRKGAVDRIVASNTSFGKWLKGMNSPLANRTNRPVTRSHSKAGNTEVCLCARCNSVRLQEG